ncbi:hypothetical protein [Thermoactinospora rubra]|uniref:hypothetical protein n=1 Tax=Thermoactinospora rubra TaxID=1088767 RepID=UPI00197F54A7|nr:hypothetical protein [Thermoactinospora rubra]
MNPGTWHGRLGVAVDLMVPDALSGSGGRRGARIPVHGNRVARRTTGLEAAVIDNSEHTVTGLADDDGRSFTIRVAGPAALLVAKTIKIDERLRQPERLSPKDSLDVLRLLQSVETNTLALQLTRLAEEPLCSETTRQAIRSLRSHGTSPAGPYATMAAQAAGPLADPDTIAATLAFLIEDLMLAVGSQCH